MNAAQGKTAIAGGKNDPSVIQKGYDETSGGRTRAYDPAPSATSTPAPAPSATPTPAPAPEKAPEITSKSPNDNEAPTSKSNFSSTVSDFLGRPVANIKNWLGSSEEESGPSKGKKKMSESTLINSFLKLQETKAGNVFESAKKMNKVCPKCGKSPCQCDGDPKKVEEEKELSPKQKKIAALAGDKDKLDAGDFAALRAKKSEKIKSYRADRDKHGEMEEEVEFSDSELAHFASIAESAGAAPVDQGKANQKKLRAPQSERGIGETLPERDLTDEYNYKYMDEMARGVKAGQKRGSYKKKATDLKGNRVASADAEPDEGSKGVPHVLDQIRHGHEDEQGFKTITHPASSPEAPVTKRIHRSELHGFYDKYHNTDKPREKEKAYSEFLGKHFSDERATAPTHKTVTSDLSKVEKANLKGGAGKVSFGGSKLVGVRK
jgi:predicted  nucleic acid-binding Zn-ribbon protein